MNFTLLFIPYTPNFSTMAAQYDTTDEIAQAIERRIDGMLFQTDSDDNNAIEDVRNSMIFMRDYLKRTLEEAQDALREEIDQLEHFACALVINSRDENVNRDRRTLVRRCHDIICNLYTVMSDNRQD